ncbi:MAG TPA: glycosyltransferase [Phenylobacterium sp.]|uniref:glycosyltransferase n=1 Tax=Phenylobacterium sp. TaxID=1871053 RepID=UPI002D08D346|nr:glycosyltransferase [Phenylobacterium sp.]HSV04804.1 glycosyltransferase [Phenylobacterium sp.]
MNAEPRRFLFATWEGGGSVAPALTVARKLARRGHRVRVMSDRCNRPEVEAADAEFRPWTRAPSRPDRSRHTDLMRDWEAQSPQEGIARTLDAVWAGPALAYAQDLIEELRREPADLVVSSDMLFGVMAGCEAMGQPLALLAANVCLYPTPGLPPMGPGLTPAATPQDEALHREIAAGVIALTDHGLPALNGARSALGLAPLEHLVDQAKAAERLLLATSRAFDFAPPSLPDHIRYVGPQLDAPSWAEPWASPWPAGDPRPLVAVGFSTSFQNHAAVMQRVIDALGELAVRGLVTLGGALEPSELRGTDNVRIVHSAPHDAVMREAAVVVTHGGHGTVSRALMHQRPMLIIPHGRDQTDNAVRVTHRGAGLSLTPAAGTAEIRTALSRLLEEPGFREAAARLGSRVAEEVRSSPVVEELEALAQARLEQPCVA